MTVVAEKRLKLMKMSDWRVSTVLLHKRFRLLAKRQTISWLAGRCPCACGFYFITLLLCVQKNFTTALAVAVAAYETGAGLLAVSVSHVSPTAVSLSTVRTALSALLVAASLFRCYKYRYAIVGTVRSDCHRNRERVCEILHHFACRPLADIFLAFLSLYANRIKAQWDKRSFLAN